MKYRAVCLAKDVWAVQWRAWYFIRGLEKDYSVPGKVHPMGIWRPTLLFSSQAAAEEYIGKTIEKEAADRAAQRKKGHWYPRSYY